MAGADPWEGAGRNASGPPPAPAAAAWGVGDGGGWGGAGALEVLLGGQRGSTNRQKAAGSHTKRKGATALNGPGTVFGVHYRRPLSGIDQSP